MSTPHVDERFMAAALDQAAIAARQGDFPVGCVLVCNQQVVATGFRRNSTGNSNEIDHAEIIALRELIGRQAADPGKTILYSTMEPCLMCFSTLILSGIRTIVYGYEDVMGGGTGLKLTDLPPLYAGMEVTVVSHILRRQCLQMFKDFFSDRKNDYWRDSLLARYTMRQ